jgi:DHA1 family bicyclomycin/chloramphenicol resistance-like MFS transporter
LAYPSWLPLLLGFLSATGPLSTDMYLPAFPAIEQEFALPLGTAQVTLAAWFAGLAIGQISQGTLADRYGRRAPLMLSTALFTLANIGCALAPNLLWLSVLRLVAAIAGSASMVIPRAIVRDLSTGHAAAKMMSRLILVSGVAPIIAPTLGGLMLAIASWHAIFWFASVYGAICWLLVMLYLPDTLPVAARVKHSLGGMIGRYRDILVEPSFLTHALMGGAGMFALFAFLGGSPGVFIDGMDLSPSAYALVFSSCAACFVLCSQLNPRMLARFGADRVMRMTVKLFLASAIAMALVAFGSPFLPGGTRWWMVMLPAMAVLGCQGFNLPNTTVGGLQRHAAHAGSASALMGMLGFCLAAISGLLVGEMSDGSARAIAMLGLLGALGANIADHFRRRDLLRS